MKIGLIDVDGKNFPNLALMKISAYHKTKGDKVEWYDPMFTRKCDVVYMSKVFTFSNEYPYEIESEKIIKGGTGYNITTKLPAEIDRIMPDYSLYDCEKAYGFLTRGCPNKCPWCVVPEKEGSIKAYMDIDEIVTNQKKVILMDNNVLAHEHGLVQIEKTIKKGISIDFNQGLDARIIASDIQIAKLLSKTKWIKYIRLACDNKSQIPFIEKAIKNLNKFGVKNWRFFVYLLVKDIHDAKIRSEFLKKMRIKPFAQPYRDFKNNIEPSHEQKRFARYCNMGSIFFSIDWKDYK